MVKIIFLGTAGSSSVLTKHARLAGGMVIYSEQAQIHLNPGPGIVTGARQAGVDLRNTICFMTTDASLLHCDDLNLAIDIITFGGIERRGLLVASDSVINGTSDEHPILSVRHKNLLEKVVVLEKGNRIGLGSIEIRAITVDADDATASGYKFITPRFILAYTGSTAYSEELVEQLMGSQLLVLHMPKMEILEGEKALDVAAVEKILGAVKPKLVVLTNFGNDIVREGPLDVAREIQRKTGVQCIAAKDGLVLSPDGFEKRSPVRGYTV